MLHQVIVALAVLAAEPLASDQRAEAAWDAAARVIELAPKADLAYLAQRWDRAVPLYRELVDANPTVGLYWWRLGSCQLEAGQYDDAIASFTRSHELGAFQWTPLRIAYRGESAWGIAAAQAEAGRKNQATLWTRRALAEGLRDIRRFQGKHFRTMLDDADYRKLVWSEDVKQLSPEEGHRHDLKFCLHELKRMHYAPFRATSEAEIDARAAAIAADIPRLSDDQRLVRLMGLARLFGDGHTQIRRDGPREYLPVWMFRFPDGLYVTGASAANADLVGAKILKIGDRPTKDLLAAAEEITPRDNSMTVLAFSPGVLASFSVLRGLGAVEPSGPAVLEIEDAAGKTRTIKLTPPEKRSKRDELTRQVPNVERPVPLSLREPGKVFWFEPVPDRKAIYCQISGIGGELREFCKRLFEAAEQPEVETLIIDMRYNGGGDTFTNVPLVEGIIRSEKFNQPGRLFVVIGRDTFSAAQNTVSELERRTKAILVGEPTGSNPNFIGESVRVILPYSGWGMSISDLWWQHSMAMDYRTWTPPMLYAPPTAEAFRAHVDPALEVIWRYREGAKQAAK